MSISFAKMEELLANSPLELVGFTKIQPEKTYSKFKSWLDLSMNAEMHYLENYQNCRENPEELFLPAKTAVVLGFNYYMGDKVRGEKASLIAQYARMRDYHRWMRKEATRLADCLHEQKSDYRVVCDTAPLLERAMAQNTGGGMVGKNTMFIIPGRGSFFLLVEILSVLEVEPGSAALPVQTTSSKSDCGTCKRCLTHCPTGAIDEPYRVDARKCISYWTIEHRGEIPLEFWPHLKEHVFGCDICQLVCPFNRGLEAQVGQELVRLPRHIDREKIALMTEAEYIEMFGGTPLTRAKRGGLMRNALISIYVAGSPRLSVVMKNLMARHDLPSVVVKTLDAIRTDPLALFSA